MQSDTEETTEESTETTTEESESTAEDELLLGDANGDGNIDILDVIVINKAILGKEEISEKQLKAIDFNHNGRPDSSESLAIMKYIVGLITSFSNVA